MAIRFFEENIKANLKDKRALKQFISQEINAVYDVKKSMFPMSFVMMKSCWKEI